MQNYSLHSIFYIQFVNNYHVAMKTITFHAWDNNQHVVKSEIKRDSEQALKANCNAVKECRSKRKTKTGAKQKTIDNWIFTVRFNYLALDVHRSVAIELCSTHTGRERGQSFETIISLFYGRWVSFAMNIW